MTRKPRIYLIVALAAVVAIAIPAASMARNRGSGGHDNTAALAALAVNPADFSTTIDNPLFPLSLVESKTFTGEETDPDTGATIVINFTSNVTGATQTVGGVETVVLVEEAYEDGELVERAFDYFAQHSDGSVYYFGEDVENYMGGVLDNTDGTWHAGVDGAEPGIVMPGSPVVGQVVQQENAPGIAEDMAEFLALDAAVSTTAGDFTGCAQTTDWNPLEVPVTFEYKFYCPGVGLAFEEPVDGGAFLELVAYTLAGTGTGTPTPTPTPDPTADPTADPTDVPPPDVPDGGADPDDDAEDADDGDDDGAPGELTEGEELLPLAAITLDEAIQAAQDYANAQGIQGELGEVELEHEDGQLIFTVEIGDEDIEVDAMTGDIITEDDEDEDEGVGDEDADEPSDEDDGEDED
jgi:hypothetical protein